MCLPRALRFLSMGRSGMDRRSGISRLGHGEDILGFVDEERLVEKVHIRLGRHKREARHVLRALVDLLGFETQLCSEPQLELTDGRKALFAPHTCDNAQTMARRRRVDQDDATFADVGGHSLGVDLRRVPLQMVEVEHVEARRDGIGVAPPFAPEGGLPHDGGKPFLRLRVAMLEVRHGRVDGFRTRHLVPPLQRERLRHRAERFLIVYFHEVSFCFLFTVR